MNKSVVIGIDAAFSLSTEHVLHVASSLLALSTAPRQIVVLHVIPLPDIPASKFGMSRIAPTAQQRAGAQRALQKAAFALHQQGIAVERIEELLRSGNPAEVLVTVAKEQDAGFIVVGSRGNSFKENVRRLLLGSTSRHVIKHAPCSVVIVPLPPMPAPCELVAWYKEAITHSLQQHAPRLTVMTASEVAHLFAPSSRTLGAQEEMAAAALALEQLALSGVLIAQHINGEVRYVND